MSPRKPDLKNMLKDEKERSDLRDVSGILTDSRGSYTLRDISLDKIQTEKQFRKNIDHDNLLELMASIRTQGLISPIEVIDGGDHYTIVHGHRRYAAFLKLNYATIPAIIRSGLSDEDILECQIITNLQYEDLSPFEEAQAYADLIRLKKLANQNELADRIGKSKDYVSKVMSLLKLSEKVAPAQLLKLPKSLLFEFVPYSDKNFLEYAIIVAIENNLGQNEIQILLDDLKKDSYWEKNDSEEYKKELLEVMEELVKKTKKFMDKYYKILTPDQIEELMVSAAPAIKKFETRINDFFTTLKD